MARDFVFVQLQQWELSSLNGPRKQRFLFPIENSRRDIGMLIFQRRTLIGRSTLLSRISFNKPRPRHLVADKTHRQDGGFGKSQTAHASPNPPLRREVVVYAAAGTGKLSKRNPKMISSTPIITAYQAMIQISAAAPAIGFHKRRAAKMIEAKPIRIRNHSPLISRRILIASATSVTPIINAHAAM